MADRSTSAVASRLRFTPTDSPDLDAFADVSDPKSALLVDPRNLSATLSWRSITLEVTDALTKVAR
jgi:hypothetical protein